MEDRNRYDVENNIPVVASILGGGAIVVGLGSLVFGMMVPRDLDAIVAGSGLFVGGGILWNGAYMKAYLKTKIEHLNDEKNYRNP